MIQQNLDQSCVHCPIGLGQKTHYLLGKERTAREMSVELQRRTKHHDSSHLGRGKNEASGLMPDLGATILLATQTIFEVIPCMLADITILVSMVHVGDYR